jgi:hypothetical protein
MKIIESNNIIKLKMFQELADVVNKSITKNRAAILSDIKTITELFLKQSDTYQSLIGGELEKSFGFPDGTSDQYVESVIQSIVNGITLRQTKVNSSLRGLSGGLSINFYRGVDILLLSSESVISYDQYKIPWLKWLLTEGDTIIISGFSISFQAGKGRSGGAIMVSNSGGVWRVPPEYSGVDSDNWITRVFTSPTFQAEIELIIKRYIK